LLKLIRESRISGEETCVGSATPGEWEERKLIALDHLIELSKKIVVEFFEKSDMILVNDHTYRAGKTDRCSSMPSMFRHIYSRPTYLSSFTEQAAATLSS
jgi:hypothetical protein